MNATYINERIAKAKELISAYDDAILAVLTNGVESYQLDTGQSTQRVTKLNIDSIRKYRDTLMNEIVTLESRLGQYNLTARPGW